MDNNSNNKYTCDVSTIIVTHNRLNYLKDAINSLFSQTFKGKYEIIVINDGSTDGTLEYLESLTKSHSNFAYYNVNTKSVIHNRLLGASLSHGRYITYLDDDDRYTVTAVEVLYNSITEDDVDLVNGSTYYVKRNNKIRRKRFAKNKIYRGKRQILRVLFHDIYVRSWFWNKIFKAELIKNIKLDDTLNNFISSIKVYYDMVPMYLIFKNINSLKTITAPIFYYNLLSENSLTKSNYRVDANILSSRFIKEDLLKSSDKSLLKIFKHSFLSRFILLLSDFKMTSYESRKIKRKKRRQAYQSLWDIYFK